jgi:hypothetical protein
VWNIALGTWEGRAEDHYLLANGVPAGDLNLQEFLERARNPGAKVEGVPPTAEEVKRILAQWFGVEQRK